MREATQLTKVPSAGRRGTTHIDVRDGSRWKTHHVRSWPSFWVRHLDPSTCFHDVKTSETPTVRVWTCPFQAVALLKWATPLELTKSGTWHVIWGCWTCRSEVPRRTWSVHNVLELISTRGKWEHPDPSGCSRVSHCRDQLQTHCDSSLKPRAKHVMVWISVDVGGFSESGTAQNRVIAGRASRRQWKCVRPSCINKRDRSWHLHMKLWVESGSLEAGHLVQKCNWIDGKEGRNLTGFQTVPRLLYFFKTHIGTWFQRDMPWTTCGSSLSNILYGSKLPHKIKSKVWNSFHCPWHHVQWAAISLFHCPFHVVQPCPCSLGSGWGVNAPLRTAWGTPLPLSW